MKLVMTISLLFWTMVTVAQDVDLSEYDRPYRNPQYLLHYVGLNTINGYQERDGYFLYSQQPEDGRFLVADGYGGTYTYFGETAAGPFSNPQQACNAIRSFGFTTVSYTNGTFLNCARLFEATGVEVGGGTFVPRSASSWSIGDITRWIGGQAVEWLTPWGSLRDGTQMLTGDNSVWWQRVLGLGLLGLAGLELWGIGKVLKAGGKGLRAAWRGLTAGGARASGRAGLRGAGRASRRGGFIKIGNPFKGLGDWASRTWRRITGREAAEVAARETAERAARVTTRMIDDQADKLIKALAKGDDIVPHVDSLISNVGKQAQAAGQNLKRLTPDDVVKEISRSADKNGMKLDADSIQKIRKEVSKKMGEVIERIGDVGSEFTRTPPRR